VVLDVADCFDGVFYVDEDHGIHFARHCILGHDSLQGHVHRMDAHVYRAIRVDSAEEKEETGAL
jgi:hypothetical protein